MNLLSFMQQKAEEKEISLCSNCGTPDIFYSLVDHCTECDANLPSKPKIKQLQFALEVLVEFTEKYDKQMADDPKKIFLQLGKALAYKIKTRNVVDNSNLIKFQYLCNHIPIFGDTSLGVIDAKKMTIAFDENATNLMAIATTLSGTLLALKFIMAYEVPNEFVLESSSNKPIQTEVRLPLTKSPKRNSGCLSTFLLLTIALSIILSSLILIL